MDTDLEAAARNDCVFSPLCAPSNYPLCTWTSSAPALIKYARMTDTLPLAVAVAPDALPVGQGGVLCQVRRAGQCRALSGPGKARLTTTSQNVHTVRLQGHRTSRQPETQPWVTAKIKEKYNNSSYFWDQSFNLTQVHINNIISSYIIAFYRIYFTLPALLMYILTWLKFTKLLKHKHRRTHTAVWTPSRRWKSLEGEECIDFNSQSVRMEVPRDNTPTQEVNFFHDCLLQT